MLEFIIEVFTGIVLIIAFIPVFQGLGEQSDLIRIISDFIQVVLSIF